MPMTEAQKRATQKWVEKNKEKYAARQRELALKYYHEHKEEISEKKKIYYLNKKLKNMSNAEVESI